MLRESPSSQGGTKRSLTKRMVWCFQYKRQSGSFTAQQARFMPSILYRIRTRSKFCFGELNVDISASSSDNNLWKEFHILWPSLKFLLVTPYSISTVLQAQIFDDINASFDNRGHQQDFDHIPILPPEHGGDVEILPGDIVCRESQHDAELRTQLIAGVVPTVETIYRYDPSTILWRNFSCEDTRYRVAFFLAKVNCDNNQLHCIP